MSKEEKGEIEIFGGINGKEFSKINEQQQKRRSKNHKEPQAGLKKKQTPTHSQTAEKILKTDEEKNTLHLEEKIKS